MSKVAIKTEKLDEEQQEEIGIESNVAVEDGVGDQEHEKVASSTDVSSLAEAGKKHLEVGRNTNISMRQLQQNQTQPNVLTKNSASDNGSGLLNPSNEIISNRKVELPKSRCGEVFVSNNARQWTFICTYCNKSTRDIGEFICHIKIKHLGGFVDDGDETDDGEYEGTQQSNFYEQDQDVSKQFILITYFMGIMCKSDRFVEIHMYLLIIFKKYRTAYVYPKTPLKIFLKVVKAFPKFMVNA